MPAPEMAAAAPLAGGWFESLMLSRAGGYIVMFVVFAAIVLLLRFLFGPRGLFRDPQWDRWNEEARREDEALRQAEARQAVAQAENAAGTKNTGHGATTPTGS